MFKKVGLLVSFLLLLVISDNHAQGINFEEGPWQAVLEKAKKEDKLVYLDAYAVWCGPCKRMQANVFPNEEVGKVYNDLFINYSVDAEKGEGKDIAKTYKVTAYPTHVYVNPHNEEVVYYMRGAANVNTFIEWGEAAEFAYRDTMNVEKYEELFSKGKKDEAFLMDYIEKLKSQQRPTERIMNEFIKLHTANINEEKWAFIVHNTDDITTNAGNFILDYAKSQEANWSEQEKDGFNQWKNSVFNQSIMKAIESKNPDKVVKAYGLMEKYGGFLPMFGEQYSLLKVFYEHVKDEEGERKNHINLLNLYTKKSLADLEKFKIKQNDFLRDFLRDRLKMTHGHLSAEELEEVVTENFNSLNIPDEQQEAVNLLKEAAHYTIKSEDKSQYKMAYKWNQKAIEFAKMEEDKLFLKKQGVVLLLLDNNKRAAKKAWNALAKENKTLIEEDTYDEIIEKHLK